jgi:anthranilate/para-aminobenzoate synthase component I
VITELEFKSLSSQGYNRIPLMAEAFADLETPLSLYLKLAHSRDGGKFSFLLESVVGGERFGRYSFIGLPAHTQIRVSGFGADTVTEVVRDGAVVETARSNPLDFIAAYQKRFKVALRPGLPRFCGGLAGYFGYDTVRHIEKKLAQTCPPDTLGCPDILLLQCEELAVIDNLSGKLYLIVYADPARPEAYANAKKRLRELREQLQYSVSAPVVKATQSYPAERDFAKADYIAAVERAKALIAGGDFMQVQVGQRIKKRYTESPLSLYRALRSLNPSPYMYYYHFGDFHVVGASPEILVRQESVEIPLSANVSDAGPPQASSAPMGLRAADLALPAQGRTARRDADSGSVSSSEPHEVGSVGATERRAGPPQASSAPSGGSEPHEVGSVGALQAAAPGRSQARPTPPGGSEPHEVGSVGATERRAGPPQASSAPPGGSEPHEVGSVGATIPAQKITIRPLAGTRPRGATPEKDKAAEAELLNDPKERAEHVMLIDLARNDIGRIAQTGSVKVTEAFTVERYSHVMHIVSNVEGLLRDGPDGQPVGNMDVLRATFPAGTLTGAPKVHAMELIDQLEPTKRGLYGGACGYLSYAGDMDVAIAIRTGIVKDGMLYVQAAAGVVADSVPELEWQETEAKARALLRAAELVEEGLE